MNITGSGLQIFLTLNPLMYGNTQTEKSLNRFVLAYERPQSQKIQAEGRGQVISCPDLYSGGPGVKSRPGDRVS
jgi:hypothetical protein